MNILFYVYFKMWQPIFGKITINWKEVYLLFLFKNIYLYNCNISESTSDNHFLVNYQKIWLFKYILFLQFYIFYIYIYFLI